MQREGRRKVIVPKRGFIQRYPRFFVFVGSTLSICVLFSKPLYDIFFMTPPEDFKKIRKVSDKV